ncbi:unnamed protein product [Clonostachys byssicola]|uniref:Carboxylic ester hydrolase n=1 Tax=Clonostachys byssicola TaxID=160290 RepID=A0A9N9UF17_9HYPO|nr:unnamed protein product [Clonostachys byssicola]
METDYPLTARGIYSMLEDGLSTFLSNPFIYFSTTVVDLVMASFSTMKKSLFNIWPSLLLVPIISADASFQPAIPCQDLARSLHLNNATIYFAELVSSGSNVTFPDQDETCTTTSVVTTSDICRLSFSIATSTISSVSLEAWLPLNWTGRFLATGNGGLNGCIKYQDLAYGTSQGFATIGTNNGHNGTSGEPLYNNPGSIEDYVYRSIYLEATVGKQIVNTFYDRPHSKSYYLGCSTGGRQGFKAAQDFPEQFDGILAGAPAFSMTSLFYASAQPYLYTGKPGAPTFLTEDEWRLVGEDMIKQCDKLDGVLDGILEDPELCQYRPESLICAKNQTTGCLTGAQVETVRSVFSPTYGPDGKFIYPRIQPAKDMPYAYYLSGEPFAYSTDWYRYVVYKDPSWDPATLSPADWPPLLETDTHNVATWKGDLSHARDAGTKILHYHGLEDTVITSENSARYYNHVSRTMELTSAELDEFYRYFRISGMNHCRGGNGASIIGSSGDNLDEYKPDSNALAALVRWVEDGVAPDSLLGKKKEASSSQVVMSRRHCKYPKRNTYKGFGDVNSADSWQCL